MVKVCDEGIKDSGYCYVCEKGETLYVYCSSLSALSNILRRHNIVCLRSLSDRTDIMEPPDTAILIEGGTAAAVRNAAARLLEHTAMAAADRCEQGLYVVEYTRLKTAHTPG